MLDEAVATDITTPEIALATHRRVHLDFYRVLLRALKKGAAAYGYRLVVGAAGPLPREVTVAVGRSVFLARRLYMSPGLDAELAREWLEEDERVGYTTAMAEALLAWLAGQGFCLKRKFNGRMV